MPNRPTSEASKHLDTGEVRHSLEQRTIRAAGMLAVAHPLNLLLGIGATMALARLLTPRQFGIFAMVAVVPRFLKAFREMGVGTVIVQRENIRDTEISGLFWREMPSMATGAVCAIVSGVFVVLCLGLSGRGRRVLKDLPRVWQTLRGGGR